MKKFIFCGLLMTSLFGFGQTFVYDVETKTTYETTMAVINGQVGFNVDKAEVVTTPDEIYHYDNTGEKPDGWRLLTGPRELVYYYDGDGGFSWGRICYNTNIWPCLLQKIPLL